MTLIASFAAGNPPSMIADRLLTTTGKHGTVHLPTVGNRHVSITMAEGAKAHSLHRKIKIYRDSALVAWAGYYEPAQIVLNEIGNALTISNDYQFIERYLRANCNRELSRTSLLLHVRHDNRSIAIWGNDCREMVGPETKIWYSGTGAPDLEQVLANTSASQFNQLHPSQRSATLALTSTGYLLASELRDGSPLSRRFGGYYDIALFQEAHPVFLQDITYAFWPIIFDGDKYNFPPPYKFIKNFDIGDGVPTIYSLEAKYDNKGIAQKSDETYYLDSPENAELVQARKGESLRSVWQVNIFMIENPCGRSIFQVHVACRPDSNGHLINCDFEKNQLKLDYSPNEICEFLGPAIARLHSKGVSD